MNEYTKVPSRESEIILVLSRLSIVTENCEKSLEELTVQLSSVCNKAEEDVEKTADPAYSTTLAQEINKIVSRLERLHKQMNYLRNRIQL